MSHDLMQLMAERISAGLRRKSLTSCSRWTENCRVMGRPFPGPWSFKYHPWSREMHDSNAEVNVGQKSAQAAFTETALNRTFFNIDVRRIDCLYVLPAATPDAHDFSSARFNPALESSEHLKKMFSEVDNIGHKRSGNVNLYIRGSRTPNHLKSVPVGMVVLDEFDEMDEGVYALAKERLSGQIEKQLWAISTPTIPKYGINKLFEDTTQEHFFFKCPCCSRLTELVFPDCLEITGEDVTDTNVLNSFYKCKECGGKLQQETKTEWLAHGIWVPKFSDRVERGFHVNQMYSSTIKPSDLAKSYLKSLRDPSEEQEFYNSKLGLPHVVEGAGVTDADIAKCIGTYKRWASVGGNALITAGVDVGRWLHFEIDKWHLHPTATVDINAQARPDVINYGKVRNFEEIDELIRRFSISSLVIDAHPETRKAQELAGRFPGIVKLCTYVQGITGKQIHIAPEEESRVSVDRTSWLDLSLGRFRNGEITLPVDLEQEYKTHLKSQVRIYEKDKYGNPVGRYVKGSDDDHYGHARNYAEIALQFAINHGVSSDIVE